MDKVRGSTILEELLSFCLYRTERSLNSCSFILVSHEATGHRWMERGCGFIAACCKGVGNSPISYGSTPCCEGRSAGVMHSWRTGL